MIAPKKGKEGKKKRIYILGGELYVLFKLQSEMLCFNFNKIKKRERKFSVCCQFNCIKQKNFQCKYFGCIVLRNIFVNFWKQKFFLKENSSIFKKDFLRLFIGKILSKSNE